MKQFLCGLNRNGKIPQLGGFPIITFSCAFPLFLSLFFFFFLEVLMKTSDIVTCGQLTEESTAVKSVLGLVNGDERESGGRQLAVCPYTFRTRKFSRDARQTAIGIVEWFTWSLALWAAPAGVILLFLKKKKTNKIFSRKSMFLENNKIYVSFSF